MFGKIGEVSPEHVYLDYLIDQMLSQNPDHRPKDIISIKKMLITCKNGFGTESPKRGKPCPAKLFQILQNNGYLRS